MRRTGAAALLVVIRRASAGSALRHLPNVEWSDEVGLPRLSRSSSRRRRGLASCGSASPVGLASEEPAAAADGWQA